MQIPPAYWTLLGEFSLLILGVCIAIIIVVLKDRSKLHNYTHFLKKAIKQLKTKIKTLEDQQGNERVLDLFNALIAHVREQYQIQFNAAADDIEHSTGPVNVDKFIHISCFQTMTAQLNALENSNDPILAWDKIKNELTPLFSHYLEPALQQHAELSKNSLEANLDTATSDELNQLKNKVAQQFEEIWALQNRIKQNGDTPPSIEEMMKGFENMARNLKDAEMCIDTMDMEIQTLTSELETLRLQGKEVAGHNKYDVDNNIQRMSQENKELLNCITGLEEDNMSQSEKIKALEAQLKNT